MTGFERILIDTDLDILLEKVAVNFREHENKLYPRNIEVTNPKPGQLMDDLKNSVYDHTTIWVDKIDVRKSLPSFNAEPKMEFLYPRKYTYNKKFWEMYAALKLHPVSEETVQALGTIAQIEDEFEKNGRAK